jgi:HK97 family phage portal protein
MGLFDFLNSKKRASPTHLRDISLFDALMSGATITREQATTLPAVAGAVDFISNMIASMPVKLYKHKQGKIEELSKDTRVNLLNSDTGDTLDGFQFKKAMVEDYLLGKGGYAYIRRYRNEVTGLFYVQDDCIVIEPVTFNPVFKDYRFFVQGQEYKLYEFIKLLRKTKDGVRGEGVTTEVAKALETAYQTLLYQLNFVKSGGNKRGFLKATKKLGQEEVNVLKKAWRDLYANNSSTVAVLNNGVEFQEASNSSVEMQLNESKKTLQDEINNIFHIKDDFYSTFKEAIYPIIKAFETALNRDLLLEKEKKNMFFEFDVKEILKANIKERYEAYKLAKETGFMTLNEIRIAENMEFIEGMDVINVGLSAVLYDTNSHKYFTPNTNSTTDLNTQKLIEDKETDTDLNNQK